MQRIFNLLLELEIELDKLEPSRSEYLRGRLDNLRHEIKQALHQEDEMDDDSADPKELEDRPEMSEAGNTNLD